MNYFFVVFFLLFWVLCKVTVTHVLGIKKKQKKSRVKCVFFSEGKITVWWREKKRRRKKKKKSKKKEMQTRGFVTVYPQNELHRGVYFGSMGALRWGELERTRYARETSRVCFTWNKGPAGQVKVYKPHSGGGSVGTTAAGYLARRRKI